MKLNQFLPFNEVRKRDGRRVPFDASKIKNAIEKVYGVKVDKVRTANRVGKLRRRGRNFGRTAGWKKAIVFLKPDNHIDLF